MERKRICMATSVPKVLPMCEDEAAHHLRHVHEPPRRRAAGEGVTCPRSESWLHRRVALEREADGVAMRHRSCGTGIADSNQANGGEEMGCVPALHRSFQNCRAAAAHACAVALFMALREKSVMKSNEMLASKHGAMPLSGFVARRNLASRLLVGRRGRGYWRQPDVPRRRPSLPGTIQLPCAWPTIYLLPWR